MRIDGLDFAVSSIDVAPLPYARQSIDSSDIVAVARSLRGDWLTQGPGVGRFEDALADAVGANHCSAVSSGTAALHIAYAALGLGPGDELITSPLTFSATANAARLLGAEIVFADVELDTGNIAPASIARKITARTRGVAAVHYGGLPPDLEALSAITRKHGLWLLEDACHALGAEYGESRVGDCTYSDATVFSTHAIKNITTGEGGAVCTQRPDVDRQCRLLRSHGIDKSAGAPDKPWTYDMVALGWNYRITDLQCVLGLSQLSKLASWLERREELVAVYDAEISRRFDNHVALQATREGRRSGRHLLAAQIDFDAFGLTRGALMRALADRGVGSQVHYIPVYQLSYYRERYGEQALPGCEQFYERQLSLPLFVDMTGDDVVFVVDELERQLTTREHRGPRLKHA